MAAELSSSPATRKWMAATRGAGDVDRSQVSGGNRPLYGFRPLDRRGWAS